MTKKDSSRRFGLIGLSLVILAFVMWALVLPQLDKPVSYDQLESITSPEVQKQTAPSKQVTDSAVPPRPSQ